MVHFLRRMFYLNRKSTGKKIEELQRRLRLMENLITEQLNQVLVKELKRKTGHNKLEIGNIYAQCHFKQDTNTFFFCESIETGYVFQTIIYNLKKREKIIGVN